MRQGSFSLPPLPLAERLDKVGFLAARARIHIEAWLMFEERGPEFLSAIAAHQLFVKTTFHAHRVTAIVETWALLDSKVGVLSLPNLVRDVVRQGLLPSVEGDQLRRRLNGHPAREKVKQLRHEAVAHRSSKVSFDDTFRVVQLSPNLLRELCHEIIDVTNRLMISGGRTPLSSLGEIAPFFDKALSALGDR